MSDARVEAAVPADGEALLELARGIRLFVPGDVRVIQELWDEFARKGPESGYHFLVARSDGSLAGFACYGHRSLTRGAYDLYWIGVGQDQQGKGVGKLLLRRVEEDVRALGGRLLIIETEGRPEYAATRAFYERYGCELEARVRDFYAPGDDLCIYTRHY